MIRLQTLIRQYKGTSHQIAAINMLEEQLPPELLEANSEWFQCWLADDYLHKDKDYNRET